MYTSTMEIVNLILDNCKTFLWSTWCCGFNHTLATSLASACGFWVCLSTSVLITATYKLRGYMIYFAYCWVIQGSVWFTKSKLCKARGHYKSVKLFRISETISECDIQNIDLRNPKHFVFLTYQYIARQVLISEKVLSGILNTFRICFLDIRKAFRICYDASPKYKQYIRTVDPWITGRTLYRRAIWLADEKV